MEYGIALASNVGRVYGLCAANLIHFVRESRYSRLGGGAGGIRTFSTDYPVSKIEARAACRRMPRAPPFFHLPGIQRRAEVMKRSIVDGMLHHMRSPCPRSKSSALDQSAKAAVAPSPVIVIVIGVRNFPKAGIIKVVSTGRRAFRGLGSKVRKIAGKEDLHLLARLAQSEHERFGAIGRGNTSLARSLLGFDFHAALRINLIEQPRKLPDGHLVRQPLYLAALEGVGDGLVVARLEIYEAPRWIVFSQLGFALAWLADIDHLDRETAVA